MSHLGPRRVALASSSSCSQRPGELGEKRGEDTGDRKQEVLSYPPNPKNTLKASEEGREL